MSNDKASTQDQIQALGALAAAIAAESVAYADWREARDAHAAANNACDDEEDDERRKDLEAKALGAKLDERQADDLHRLAILCRQRLQELCEGLGAVNQ